MMWVNIVQSNCLSGFLASMWNMCDKMVLDSSEFFCASRSINGLKSHFLKLLNVK